MASGLGRPVKRVKLVPDDESDDVSSDTSGGVALRSGKEAPELKINKDFARRFEHNSKRAERHKCKSHASSFDTGSTKTVEEKYGKDAGPADGAEVSEDEDSSSDEEEDDEGILALGALDDEYNATLHAIRNRDPKVYDTTATFYTVPADDDAAVTTQAKQKKPKYLQDYHRENLLQGNIEFEDEDKDLEPTYADQQEHLKRAVVKEMHDAVADDLDDDDNFLVAKIKTQQPIVERAKVTITAPEVENANTDPEAFLSKFLSSRAWVEQPSVELHPFESDDEEEDERAEAIEEAYNFRFEDPSKANEHLVSHARDAAAKYSVRKEPSTRRQRARDAEAERRDTAKQERKLEKARLRKLRIEEAEEKLERIKEAAGSRQRGIEIDEWQELLAGDWDEAEWEEEMKRKFDDAYYEKQSGSENDEEQAGPHKPKKPKWKEEIVIKDLVPEFDEGQDARFSLSSDQSDHEAEAGKVEKTSPERDQPDIETQSSKPKSKKERKKDRLAAKVEQRKQRQRLENLVDAKLDMDLSLNTSSKPSQGDIGFRYRDTSPISFGMTPKDILQASDSQLNQYAGIKKLASFRDPQKKQRDKKRLGKRARLREWRRETFGSERGPRKSLQDYIQEQLAAAAPSGADDAGGVKSTKHNKRKRDKSSGAA